MEKWLAALRHQTNAVTGLKNTASRTEDLRFCLTATETNGVVLKITNSKGQPVVTNYLDYTGAVRQLLGVIHRIQEHQDFIIDWDNPSRDISLGQHPYLVALLEQCGHVVDEEGKPLHFAKSLGRLIFQISRQTDDQFQAKHVLETDNGQFEQFTLVHEQLAWHGQELLPIPPVGTGFEALQLFNTSFKAEQLTFFLSLYFSQMGKVALSFEDYRLQENAEPIEAEPCIVFEKIDVDNSLYMSVNQMLPGLAVDALRDYPIHRFAQIRDAERTITLRHIQRVQFEHLVYDIEQRLKGKGKSKGNAGYFREDTLFVITEELAGQFIAEHLPYLLQNFRLMGAEKLREYKVSAKPPKLVFKPGSGIDFLEGSAEVAFGDQSINIFDLLQQFRKQKYILLADGNKAVLDEQYIRKLERIFKPATKNKKDAKVSVFDLPLLEDLLEEGANAPVFKKSRALFEGFAGLEKAKTKLPPINATLRPYQKYGYQWLNYLKDNQLGGCLADDMGLGKTLQTICILTQVYNAGETRPSLVVCPRSLLHNWQKECDKFSPGLKTHIYYGSDRNLQDALQAQVIITTYAIMRNDIKAFKDVELCYAILDESQNIKNLETQTTRAAFLLKASHRLAISGTPIENNLGELYSLFHFLIPGMFGSYEQFNADYGMPIQRDNDPVATEYLRRKIFPFILRRRKKDVLADLPDKTEQTIYVDMTDAQQALYESRRRYYQELVQQQVNMQGVEKSQFIIFQALNELRQIATIPEHFTDGKVVSAKRELLLEQLEEVLANGHKALIFVNFLAAIEILGTELDTLGVDYVTMTGATRNRQALVDRFQQDPNCRVFLLTLKTGGTGLNLTAASTVFIYDPWWNVAAETQAIDRTHRIGQVNKVHALRIIASGTIEEKIRLLQEQKQALFDSVIGADGASLKALSQDDIDFMLSK